jgi:putative PIG3 family NAD(P)H quinone oxidoreductase
MQAIVFDQPGDESVLRLAEVDAPEMRDDGVRIAVRAAGVNRADLLQRQGGYPPPAGASPLLGLECAGEVIEVGSQVYGWDVGDRVMALLPGGGYASEVVVHEGSVLRVPEALSDTDAAAIPEVMLTVFRNVFQLGGLPDGGSVLVHGGGSGIGTATIGMLEAFGGSCIVTAGSAEKCERCLELGAIAAANYNEDDFVDVVKEATDGEGVDVVLDSIGAPYLEQNLASLALEGRLVLIGLMGGAKAEISLATLLLRRLQVIGSTLRALPEPEKAELVMSFLVTFGDALETGELAPVVDRVLPLAEAAEAHRVMKQSAHFGKIVLEI